MTRYFIFVERGEGFAGNTEDSVTLDLFRALIYMVAIWMYEKLLRYLWFVNSFIYINIHNELQHKYYKYTIL